MTRDQQGRAADEPACVRDGHSAIRGSKTAFLDRAGILVPGRRAGGEGAAMKHTIQCRGFRALAKGSLVGFAIIHIRELHLVIYDVALHRKGASRWAQLPAKPMLRDGRHVADGATGKPAYVPILEFDDRETRDAFASRVWAAVIDKHPELGAGEAAA
jgi:hypothetical protein